MRWMITDSGLGGLSVCAGLEEKLLEANGGSGIDLLYVNATPDDRIGYNALETQAERISLFDKFLWSANTLFAPDEIAIACNTLSVIYDQTSFAEECSVDVSGIVEAGVELCEQNLACTDEKNVIIFATETTTETNTYPNSIHSDAKIIGQACPGLAHAISNDASGVDCRNLLEKYVDEALQKFEEIPRSVLAFLGCTHYGYQSDIFREVLEKRGIATSIINPNDRLIQKLQLGLQKQTTDSDHKLTVRFITRYPIPQVEIDSMVAYLGKSAPLTLQALQSHEVMSHLFDSK